MRQVRDVDEESAQRGQRHLETCRTRTATVRLGQDLSKCKLACFKSSSSDRQTDSQRTIVACNLGRRYTHASYRAFAYTTTDGTHARAHSRGYTCTTHSSPIKVLRLAPRALIRQPIHVESALPLGRVAGLPYGPFIAVAARAGAPALVAGRATTRATTFLIEILDLVEGPRSSMCRLVEPEVALVTLRIASAPAGGDSCRLASARARAATATAAGSSFCAALIVALVRTHYVEHRRVWRVIARWSFARARLG